MVKGACAYIGVRDVSEGKNENMRH